MGATCVRRRRKRVFADPAMDQSMREVGVSFHAHDLVARPHSRGTQTQPDGSQSFIHARQSPTEAGEKNMGQALSARGCDGGVRQ
jgi:hypothetical protein